MSRKWRAVRQQVPASFVAELIALHGLRDGQFGWALRQAREAGWTIRNLAAALSMTPAAVARALQRAAVQPRVLRLVIPVPPSPVHGHPYVEPPEHMELGSELVAELRALQTAACRVRGGWPAGHPDRVASETLSAYLNTLWKLGVRAADLAAVLDVCEETIWMRLARHGYRPLPPSMADRGYQGGS